MSWLTDLILPRKGMGTKDLSSYCAAMAHKIEYQEGKREPELSKNFAPSEVGGKKYLLELEHAEYTGGADVGSTRHTRIENRDFCAHTIKVWDLQRGEVVMMVSATKEKASNAKNWSVESTINLSAEVNGAWLEARGCTEASGLEAFKNCTNLQKDVYTSEGYISKPVEVNPKLLEAVTKMVAGNPAAHNLYKNAHASIGRSHANKLGRTS